MHEFPAWAPWVKMGVTAFCLGSFWLWESLNPLVHGRAHRWRHGGRNLGITLFNAALMAFAFGSATVGVASWTEQQATGLLFYLGWTGGLRFMAAILLLDAWMYVWHRLNHTVPLLWRFHRMHHSDPEMDVTTATRFHLGELTASALLRLGLIPLFGVSILEILIYETFVVACTMFHHANISLGRADRLVRCCLVSPRMHQIHHSRWQPETDSNYSVIFSWWDRIAGSFRMRHDDSPVVLGLDEFSADYWQTMSGMLRTPFSSPEQQQATDASEVVTTTTEES